LFTRIEETPMRTQARSGVARALLPAIALLSTLPAFTDARAAPYRERQGKEVVDAVCSKCHLTGEAGAPKIGDRPAWIPRLRNGLDALVSSATHGHGAMPARGGLADLSDQEIRGAIVYMFNHGLPVGTAAAAAAPPAPADPRHRIVSGTDIYLGMLQAQALRKSGASDAPAGKDYYHVNISLADHRSQAPVGDAQVDVRVSDGMTTQRKPLGPMAANNTVSYGNYFRFASGTYYNITAEIRRPGVPGTIEAKFEFKAP
jgi:cytochrome c5